MEITELRVGNIVRHDKQIKIVDAIRHDAVDFFVGIDGKLRRHYQSIKIEGIGAVLLSEDRLKEFGFKKDVGNNKIPIMRHGGLYVYLDDFTFTWMGNIIPANGFVHELQNVFFVLHGKELLSAKTEA